MEYHGGGARSHGPGGESRGWGPGRLRAGWPWAPGRTRAVTEGPENAQVF